MTRASRIAWSLGLMMMMIFVNARHVTGAEPSGAKELPIARVYALSDLPVYFSRAGGVAFDPSVLIAYVKSSIDPESWNGDARIHLFRQNAAMVVIQTRENQERIGKLLDSFRRETRND